MAGTIERFIQFRLRSGAPSWDVLEQVRRQRFSTKALLTGLQSEDRDVREVLASLALRPRMLEPLTKDPDPRVRRAVAMNRAVTTELLMRMVDDPDVSVVSVVLTELRCRGWNDG